MVVAQNIHRASYDLEQTRKGLFTILGPFDFVPFWDHFGTILGPFWDHFGTIFGKFLIALRERPLLQSSPQNLQDPRA